jgi:hypothetical protein
MTNPLDRPLTTARLLASYAGVCVRTIGRLQAAGLLRVELRRARPLESQREEADLVARLEADRLRPVIEARRARVRS